MDHGDGSSGPEGQRLGISRRTVPVVPPPTIEEAVLRGLDAKASLIIKRTNFP
jgi:hypothetical protein